MSMLIADVSCRFRHELAQIIAFTLTHLRLGSSKSTLSDETRLENSTFYQDLHSSHEINVPLV